LPAIGGRDRHTEEPGLLQALDIIPRLFFGGVDLGSARSDLALRQFAGPGLQRPLRRGKVVLHAASGKSSEVWERPPRGGSGEPSTLQNQSAVPVNRRPDIGDRLTAHPLGFLSIAGAQGGKNRTVVAQAEMGAV
jgi:hypothetical protein